ncbi:hypothetical protein D3C73_1158980 [compost metagenome]
MIDCTTKNITAEIQKPNRLITGPASEAIPSPAAMVSKPATSICRERAGVVANRGSAMAPAAAASQGREVSKPICRVLRSPYLPMMPGRKKITV